MNDITKSKGNIMIGEGVNAVGNFTVPGLAQIEGSFHGDLTADELVVGVNGQLVGNVKARQAEVLGETRQELQVSGKLIVRKTGRVNGTAAYGELEVERGGSLQGALRSIKDEPEPVPASGGQALRSNASLPTLTDQSGQ